MSVLRPDLLPTLDELVRLRAVASGSAPGDLVIRGGRVLHVHTGELLERDVVIAGRHIAAVTPVGRFDAPVVVPAHGAHVVPSFLDAHLHIEYTMLTPGELGRLIVPRGTTTVLTDADCLANVAGMRGIQYMGRTGTPLRILDQITPQTPISPELERGGAAIAEEEMLAALARPTTATLGESNPYDYSDRTTNRYHQARLHGKRITGHTARMADEALWGYLAAGVSDDHNAATLDEAIARVRLGVMITIMSGSMNDNVDSILGDLERVRPALGHMCFCADDKHVLDLANEGHIDHGVRRAIALGVDPAQAYRMASWQPAQYYGLDHVIGSVAPARLADLLVIDDLADARPRTVLVGGRVVAEDGVAAFANDDPVPAWTRGTVVVPEDFGPERLRIPSARAVQRVQAVEMYDGYFKRGFAAELPVRDGVVRADLGQDLLKLVVADRHVGDGLAHAAFVRGFGLRRGAMATSTNCANMNIAALGADDEDLALAIREIGRLGGGFVVVDAGEVIASVPLPVGGAMSDAPWEVVAGQLARAHAAVEARGCGVRSPFMILSFAAFIGVPEYGLSERGFVDVAQQSFTPLLLDPDPGD